MTRAMRAVSRAPSAGPRYLRWALVREGRVIAGAVLPPDRELTVGADGDIPCAGIERRALATQRDGAWHLSVRSGWSCRVGDRTLGDEEIELEGAARARIAIDGATVLIELIERPAARSKPKLPASVRGGALSSADWWFTAFVAGSALLHFAFVVVVLESDWPIDPIYDVPPRMATVIFDGEVEPPPDDQVEEISDRDADDDAHPTDEVVANERHSEHRAPQRPTRDRNPTFTREDAARTVTDTRRMLDEGFASAGIVADAPPAVSQDAIIASAQGPAMAMHDPNELRERDRGCPTCGLDTTLRPIGGVERGGRRMDEGSPIEEREVVVNVPSIDDIVCIYPAPPDFEMQELQRAIRARMRAVQACYEHALTHENPDLRGRVAIEMRVMPAGTMSGVRADENTTGSSALGACVVRTLSTVRVLHGPEEPVEVRFPFVFERP